MLLHSEDVDKTASEADTQGHNEDFGFVSVPAAVKLIQIRGCYLFEEGPSCPDANSLIKQCKSNPDKATKDVAKCSYR